MLKKLENNNNNNMTILSYSWRYDTAKYQVFSWWSPDTRCKDFLLTKVANPMYK